MSLAVFINRFKTAAKAGVLVLGCSALSMAAPLVKTVTPPAGALAGGTTITINGSGFVSGASVSLGGVAATQVTFVSSTQITAITPAHVAGTVPVTVTNPDGTKSVLSSRLSNPGFESALSGWTASGTGAAIAGSNSLYSHTGTGYLEVTAASGQHPTVFAAASDTYFPVQVGEVLTFGGYVSRVSGNGYARYMLITYNSSKGNAAYISPSTNNVSGTTWTNQTGTYVVPSGVAYVRMYSEIYQPTTSTTVRFDDAVLSGGYTYTGTAPAPSAYKLLFGMRYGANGTDMTSLQDLERWQGKKNSVVLMFTAWCNTSSYMTSMFNKQMMALWNNKNIPIVSWEAYLCSGQTTPTDIEGRAANGEYDAYFNAWAANMKTWLAGPDGVYGTSDDRRAYLRMPHEMNGNWYPWSPTAPGESPWQYVQMWRRIHGIFEAKGIDSAHLQWMWIPNTSGVYKAEDFYPGDAYVDWVGLDAYNFGTLLASGWHTPGMAMDNMVGRLKALTSKPIALAETGTSAHTTTGLNYSAKNQWLLDLFTYLSTNNIRMVSYFNKDIGNDDFTIFGGTEGNATYTSPAGKTYNVFTGYKQAISPTWVLSPDTSNPRLLTDSEFAGKF